MSCKGRPQGTSFSPPKSRAAAGYLPARHSALRLPGPTAQLRLAGAPRRCWRRGGALRRAHTVTCLHRPTSRLSGALCVLRHRGDFSPHRKSKGADLYNSALHCSVHAEEDAEKTTVGVWGSRLGPSEGPSVLARVVRGRGAACVTRRRREKNSGGVKRQLVQGPRRWARPLHESVLKRTHVAARVNQLLHDSL